MKLFLTSTLVFFCLFSKGQSYQTDSISIKNIIVNDWITYFSNSDVEINYKVSQCDPSIGYDSEMILLKVENKTSSDILMDWHMILYYSQTCKTCDYFDEYHYSISLPANNEIQGNCDINSNYQLKIFSKFIDPNYTLNEQLTSFELRGLTVQMD